MRRKRMGASTRRKRRMGESTRKLNDMWAHL
jgi:hypothetical protein